MGDATLIRCALAEMSRHTCPWSENRPRLCSNDSETDRARLAGIRHSGVSAIFDKPLTVASLRGALQRLLA